MSEAKSSEPVKLFCGLLAGKVQWLGRARELLEAEFGPVDLASEVWPFDFTDYYEREMGRDLKRQFLSFVRTMPPEDLAGIKLLTNELEKRLSREFSDGPERPVNIDPGYLNGKKVILATTKNYSHRIYLRDGIYAEVTLHWGGKEYEPWPWTYPDYRSEAYRKFFARVRERFLSQSG
jgi:hypothetical protein